MSAMRQTPLTCSGHTRPVVHLSFSEITEHGYFMISACKGIAQHCQVLRPLFRICYIANALSVNLYYSLEVVIIIRAVELTR